MARRSKYGVDLTKKGKQDRTYQGIQYDSKTEMLLYKEYLEPRIKSGEIEKVERQVTYTLLEGFTNFEGKKVLPIHYRSDFDVYYSNGDFEVLDAKGIPDNVSLLKRKLFWDKYPDIPFKFMCRSLVDGGWIEYDKLKKLRSVRKKKKAK